MNYVPIELEDFKEKVRAVFKNLDFTALLDLDLSKVEFDWENSTHPDDDGDDCFSNYPVGFKTLKDDFHVCFINAGGDWEFPICFVVYWDGDEIRGYIPKDGNAYDKVKNIAYGNDDSENERGNDKIEQEEVDSDKIIAEVLKEITLKS